MQAVKISLVSTSSAGQGVGKVDECHSHDVGRVDVKGEAGLTKLL